MSYFSILSTFSTSHALLGVQIYSGWVGVGELVAKIVFAFVQILPQICNGPQTCLSVIKCLAKVAESIWIAAAAIST